MDVSRELLFFFSTIGAFNGLILGLYFFLYAKPKHISNRFLGILLIALSIRIGKSVFFYFNPDLAGIYLHFGLTACVFIGPALYFYLKSMIAPRENNRQFWKYHFLILLSIILVVSFIYPYWENLGLWRNYIINLIYLEWLIYIIASGVLIRKVVLNFQKRKNKIDSVEVWILSVFIGNVVIWFAYNLCAYTSYITGALSFSFLLYLLLLLLLFSKKKQSILFTKQIKYADKKIANTEKKRISKELTKLMLREKLYKKPSLKLSDVAQSLNISPHLLSQFINDNLGKNFSIIVNEYRINEAKKLIQSNDRFSLEGIGYECGFKSKSTFFTTFKKMTGTTPAKFKNQLIR